MMKERPILFSAPMVRAILNGHKTQTRRIAKAIRTAQPEASHNPFGSVGDRLWVKETWSTPAQWDHFKPSQLSSEQLKMVCYCADGIPSASGKIRSSLFMPRAASRILLEIVDVRVEYLLDISESDAVAEGVPGPDAIRNYANLWDNINGRGSWSRNPMVWVVSFKRVIQELAPSGIDSVPACRSQKNPGLR